MFSPRLTAALLACPRVLGAGLVAFTLGFSTRLPAEPAPDWPQFLGPQRNGIYFGPPPAKTWPKEGPPVVWQRAVGAGFAGPAVSGERLVVFHSLSNRAVVEGLEARTGKAIWKSDYATDYRDDFGFDDGPRATPTIAAGRVLTYGAEGRLSCWNLETGEALWAVDAVKDFGSRKGFFGRASAPLVENGLVIVMPGGREGAGIAALEVATGKVRWQATGDEASYGSPTVATVQGQRILLALTREALVALEPADGRVLFRQPWRPRESTSVTAATPLVVDDLIFLSACYGADAGVFRFRSTGPDKLWTSAEVLSNHYATSIHHGGFLYGWHGRQEQGCELRCVELLTGKIRWRESGLKAGSITLAGDELLVLTERGLLLRAPASPDGFKPTAQAQILPSNVRAFPALANGFLFARSKDRLWGLNLRPDP